MAGWLNNIGRLFRTRNASLDPIVTSQEVYDYLTRGSETKTGERVNWRTALEVTTVLACCRVIAEGVSQIPFRVYQDSGTGRIVAKDHPLHRVISARPNSWQTSFEFRETIIFHLMLTSNAYVFKGTVGRSRVIKELVPIEPHRVEVLRDGYTLTYRVTAENGEAQVFPAEAIWHLRGPSWDSWRGMDAVKLAREAIGLAMATESSHSLLHKNGARPSGVYTVEHKIDAAQVKALSAWIEAHVSGPQSHRPLIVDQGAKWQSLTMTGVDSQHLETRKFQIEEICRAFRVMPIMVGYSDKASTYASAEQMFLAHVVHTLTPWYQRLEQSADANLLTEADFRAGYYTKFIPNALMRGAAKDRGEFYAKALGSGGSDGWMTANEVRALEELDQREDGDELPKRAAAAADPAPPPDGNGDPQV